METAKMLLISAQTLLSLVFGMPNLPEDVRNNAITTANTAITYAQNSISSSIDGQTYGAVLSVGSSRESATIAQESITTETRKVEDFYVIKVAVVKDERYIPNAEIRMITDNNLYTEEWAYVRKTNARTHGFEDWYTEFTYKPTTDKHVVTFTYNGITKTLDL